MNQGKYVFAQLAEFLPERVFDGMVEKFHGNRYVKHFTCWNQLLSMIFGRTTSSQMGLGPITLVKLHSFFVAAEAACSKGDFPVATVEATLVAVIGFAAAAVTTVVPAELAAAVLLAPSAAKGAAHP